MIERSILKDEALSRMSLLHLASKVVSNFKDDDCLYYSEDSRDFKAILHWVENDEILKQKIHDFEEENNALVYHVHHVNTYFGDLYSFFYVSQHQDEWEMDREDLQSKQAFVYVWNRTVEEFSEFGSICWDSKIGGITRTS